jgi:2,5-diamino-6-(ribosylamino)-4(3H)-pyrimidinone 5'-phosphate reductase
MSPKLMSRPKVWSNFAITLDGKITTRNHTPALFTSKEDKKRLTYIRSLGDAILVGRATLVKDNMAMGLPNAALRAARVERGQQEYPLRVIISNSGVIPADLKVFQKMVAPVVIFTTELMPQVNRDELAGLATIHISRSGTVDLHEALRILAKDFHVNSICCEAGPTLFRSMLEADLIDELYLTVAPVLFGGKEAPTITGTRLDFI